MVWNTLPSPWKVSFEEAWEAYCHGSIPIGAALVDETGQVICHGRNRIFETEAPYKQTCDNRIAHAEINVLMQVNRRTHPKMNQYTIYTTTEPCDMSPAACTRLYFTERKVSAMMNIRLAEPRDIDQLVCMRWDFTYEHVPAIEASYKDFHEECKAFLEETLIGGKWFIWVAEIEGRIASHNYIELIDKVPRPGRITHPFAYMTNVYTIPEYRSQGIGSKLLGRIEEWGREKSLEFIMVWPSDDAIPFYSRKGYKHCTEPLELKY